MKTKKPSIVIWGASGHAKVVADVLKLERQFTLVGFIDDINPASRKFMGFEVFGGREALPELKKKGVSHIIFGFGNCQARLDLAAVALGEGFTVAKATHPSAIVAADAVIGDGTVIAAGAIINPGCRIGANVIINTRASIDHDSEIGDGTHICPGVTIGGSVCVGVAAWIGIGATVKDHINIGAKAVIGAGSVVVRDIPEGALAYGVPAKCKNAVTCG